MSDSRDVRSDMLDTQGKSMDERNSDLENLVKLLLSHMPEQRTLTSHLSQAAIPRAGTTYEHANVDETFESAARKSTRNVAGLKRKADADADAESNATKMQRHQLPQLHDEILVRVLTHLSVEDIGTARLTCRLWRQTVDDNALELWRRRCKALGLLPAPDADCGLGAASDLLCLLENKIRLKIPTHAVRPILLRAYRGHYWDWVPRCSRCKEGGARPRNACCADPSALPCNLTRERWLVNFFLCQMLETLTNLTNNIHPLPAQLRLFMNEVWSQWVDGHITKSQLLGTVGHFVRDKFPNFSFGDEQQAMVLKALQLGSY